MQTVQALCMWFLPLNIVLYDPIHFLDDCRLSASSKPQSDRSADTVISNTLPCKLIEISSNKIN